MDKNERQIIAISAKAGYRYLHVSDTWMWGSNYSLTDPVSLIKTHNNLWIYSSVLYQALRNIKEKK